jgi:hypothetical protein
MNPCVGFARSGAPDAGNRVRSIFAVLFSPVFRGAPGILVIQALAPDPFSPRARDARGRFAKGSSGNPRGRPRGIRNPCRRVPDLLARPLSPKALSVLIDRKPHLLRPLAEKLLPRPASIGPAERLGSTSTP